ncbi:MAG: DJ-1/PfpI family protein [Clostridia bacterium]
MVYFLVADGFEDMELIAPVDVLRRGDVPVCIVGIGGRTASSRSGVSLILDAEIKDGLPDMEALILPGGQPGVTNLMRDTRVLDAVKAAVSCNILLCAICAAPIIPDSLGLLHGVRATCHPSCTLTDATYSDAPVVPENNFITARGAGCATAFGLAILCRLKGMKSARDVASAMCFTGEIYG